MYEGKPLSSNFLCPTYWAQQENSTYKKRKDAGRCSAWAGGRCQISTKLAGYWRSQEFNSICEEVSKMPDGASKEELCKKQQVPHVRATFGGMRGFVVEEDEELNEVGGHGNISADTQQENVERRPAQQEIVGAKVICGSKNYYAPIATYHPQIGDRKLVWQQIEIPSQKIVKILAKVEQGGKPHEIIDVSKTNEELLGCSRFTRLFHPSVKMSPPTGYKFLHVDLDGDLFSSIGTYVSADDAGVAYIFADLFQFSVAGETQNQEQEQEQKKGEKQEEKLLKEEPTRTLGDMRGGDEGPYLPVSVFGGESPMLNVICQADSGCLVDRIQQSCISEDFYNKSKSLVISEKRASVRIVFGQKENAKKLETKYVTLDVGIQGSNNGDQFYRNQIKFLVVPGLNEDMVLGYKMFMDLGIGFERAPKYLVLRNVPKKLFSAYVDGMLVKLGPVLSMNSMITVPAGEEVEVDIADCVKEQMKDPNAAYILDVSPEFKAKQLEFFPGPTVLTLECMPEVFPVTLYNPNVKSRCIEVSEICLLKMKKLPEGFGAKTSLESNTSSTTTSTSDNQHHKVGSSSQQDDTRAGSHNSINSKGTDNEEPQTADTFCYPELRATNRRERRGREKAARKAKKKNANSVEELARHYGGISAAGDADLKNALENHSADLFEFLSKVKESNEPTLLSSVV